MYKMLETFIENMNMYVPQISISQQVSGKQDPFIFGAVATVSFRELPLFRESLNNCQYKWLL